MYIKVNGNNEILETCSEPIEGGFEYDGELDFAKICFAKFENGQVVYDEKAYKESEKLKLEYIDNQNKIDKIKKELGKLSEDIIQYQAGEIVPNYEERKKQFVKLHNKLRVLEGKEPRVLVDKEK